MKMTRILVIYSQYGPVIKVCERNTFFQLGEFGRCTNSAKMVYKNGKRCNLGTMPSGIALQCRLPPQVRRHANFQHERLRSRSRVDLGGGGPHKF